MKEWIVEGNKELSGEIRVSGAKNSLLALIVASIVSKSIVTLENVTPLYDTYVMIDILKKLNVRVVYDNKSKMIIDSRNIKNVCLDNEEVTKIRASYYFMGALLSMYSNVSVITPGGCKFASRPIDLHLYAFNELGCEYKVEDNIYIFKKSKIKSRKIVFEKVSVGATINAILASCRVRGNVVLLNTALEPEVDDLINFLNKCGANISRNGKDILIKGVRKLHGCSYKVMEDRIEAGTYLVIGACCGKNLKVIYHESDKLKSLIEVLKNININLEVKEDYILVNKCEFIKDANIIFDVYPSIATDLQQPLSILLTRSENFSVLKDKIYPSRYTQVNDLNSMGFKMEVRDKCLYVFNSNDLKGNSVSCKDLRGGVSLVIAGLITRGKTVIQNVEHIERGYFDIINKLTNIGARIYEKN